MFKLFKPRFSLLGALLVGVAASFGIVPVARATTVRRAPVSELCRHSDVIFHGVVRHVDDQLATGPDGPFLTAIELEVLEVIAGMPRQTRTFELIIPGGRAFERVARIPGMPALRQGDEVVLLLERTKLSYIFTGLSQGVFHVDRGSAVPRVQRHLEGLSLVGAEVLEPALPTTLEALLVYARRYAAEGSPR